MRTHEVMVCEHCGTDYEIHDFLNPPQCFCKLLKEEVSMKVEELEMLPCPSCGADPYLSSDGGCKDFAVHCSCGMTMKQYGFDSTARKVIERWNKRNQKPNPKILKALATLHSLVKLKYGNSDEDISKYLSEVEEEYFTEE